MLPMFYKEISALNITRHESATLLPVDNYSFAETSHAIAIGVSEFASALSEYPIVFVKAESRVLPMILTGLESEKNMFVAADGTWLGKYLPAYVRRYPFVLAQGENDIMTVCIDEAYSGLNKSDEGERLFENQQQTAYLKNAIEFLQAYEQEMKNTEVFCQYLNEFNLLEESSATVEKTEQAPHSISGFFVISREKLENLTAAGLKKLQQVGVLEPIYQHLNSLPQFDRLLEKSA